MKYYSETLGKIFPTVEELEKAEAKFEEVEKEKKQAEEKKMLELKKAEAGIKMCNDKMKRLEEEYSQVLDEKEKFEEEIYKLKKSNVISFEDFFNALLNK